MKRCLSFIFVFLLCGCWKENMGSQPKFKPLQQSDFFSDGTSARPAVIGTIPRGGLETDSVSYDKFPQRFPSQGSALRETLRRGQELYTINCIMCHGDAGDGHGIVAERGFPVPPSFHLDRLRTAPVGHFFDVISNGYGAMYSFGDRIPPADRWDIVAYIRVLQMSQAAEVSQLSSVQKNELDSEVK
jgi:mono/diheme cytochrome c family protein